MKKLKKLSLQKETLLNLRVAAAGPQQNVDKPSLGASRFVKVPNRVPADF